MEKTEFSIQIDTAEQKKMSEEPMKQEEAVSKVHEKLEKQEPLIELRNIYKIYYMGDEEVTPTTASAFPSTKASSSPSSANLEAENQP